jgi:cyclic-di-GMP-binding protein
MFFTDARSCKDWLTGLPLTNIPGAQQMVLDGLRLLGRSDFDSIERLKCLELMRDKIAFLQGEQRSRYFGKSLPLSANDNAAWMIGCSLLEEMESGYRQCLTAAELEQGELARHTALMMQRVIRYLGAQMLFHAMIYRRFDPQLWGRLHAQYQAAERADLLDERIKDSLEGDIGQSSVMESYTHVVLTQAGYLSEMTAPQMDFMEALLRMWTRKVRVLPLGKGVESNDTHPLAVDLAKHLGARPVAGDAMNISHRVLDVESLSKSIRRRIHALQAGEEPASLGLPPDASALESLTQLQRLHKLWCEGAPPRPPAKIPEEQTATLAFGIPEIHYFVTEGKTFEQPDKPRELSRQEKDDIAMFGQVSTRTAQMRVAAEQAYAAEDWGVIDEMLGAFRLLRPNKASKGVAIGRVVAMRLGPRSPFYLGVIHALVQENDGRIVITVTVLPGKPEPIAARAGDARNRAAGSAWVQAFRLPAIERLGVPESLLVPSGLAGRGRGVEGWRDGEPKETTVYEVLERGGDFDRITVF